jgi:hypothetical protein
MARVLTAALLIALSGGATACERSQESNAPTPDAATDTPSHPSTDVIDRARIEACAGFTVDKAAELLGVSAADLEVQTGSSELTGGQLCRYWSAESLIGPGLQFVLESESSPAAAAQSLGRLRQDAPAGDAAIRGASGQPATGAAVVGIDGIGDEALWEALTNAVNVRVGNVLVSVQASSSRRAVEHDERAAIALERRVAEEVVRGLR